MLKLGAKKEAQRIVLLEASGDEPEAFIVMAPITPPMRRRAQRAARKLLGEEVTDLNDIDLDQLIDIGELASRELVRLGAIEWGGIAVEGDVPDPLTPDRETRFASANAEDRPTGTIDRLLDNEELFAILDEQYVRPDALRRAEKNVLSALPSGIGKAGTPGSNIASSAARPPRKAAAKSAPTGKTSSSRKPRKAAGKS